MPERVSTCYRFGPTKLHDVPLGQVERDIYTRQKFFVWPLLQFFRQAAKQRIKICLSSTGDWKMQTRRSHSKNRRVL
jgi:hypothetical protein